jgi:antitoxin component YwqK of YwqJK toxin-antitoxin module
MNKNLLISGLGLLFLSNAFSQKVAYSIPRTLPLPIPALSVTASHRLHIDEHLPREGDRLIAQKENGDTLLIGGLRRDHLQGEWKSFHHPGQLLDSGRLQRSVPDGEWKTWYPNGLLRSIRTYDAEKLAYVKNEIERKEGRSTFFALTGIAKKNMAAARHMMTASYSYHTFDTEHHSQQASSLEKRVAQNASRNSYLAPFTECLHHGLFMNFFPDGSMRDSGYYRNGVREGLWKEWNEAGTILATGAYRQGRPSGDWKFYNREGRLLYIQLYSASGKLKETVKMRS